MKRTGSDGEQDEDVEANSGQVQGEGDDAGKRSAIKKHLLSNSQCRSVYDDSCFTVLCRARRFSELKVLEAVFIRKHNPSICMQKENFNFTFNPLRPIVRIYPYQCTVHTFQSATWRNSAVP